MSEFLSGVMRLPDYIAKKAQEAEFGAPDFGMERGPIGSARFSPLGEGERRENDDGSYSTELLATEVLPSGEVVNFPTLWMGPDGPEELDPDRAYDAFMQYERMTGLRAPRYTSIEEGVEAAKSRSHAGGALTDPLFRR